MRGLLVLFTILTACAPVRDNDGDVPYCEDDEYEPSNTEETAIDMEDGGLFELILCPGNDDFLAGRLNNYGYIEVTIQWPEITHTGVVEVWRDQTLVGSTETQPQQQFYFSAWDSGDYIIKGTQEVGNEAESVSVQAYIQEDVVIGR